MFTVHSTSSMFAAGTKQIKSFFFFFHSLFFFGSYRVKNHDSSHFLYFATAADRVAVDTAAMKSHKALSLVFSCHVTRAYNRHSRWFS